MASFLVFLLTLALVQATQFGLLSELSLADRYYYNPVSARLEIEMGGERAPALELRVINPLATEVTFQVNVTSVAWVTVDVTEDATGIVYLTNSSFVKSEWLQVLDDRTAVIAAGENLTALCNSEALPLAWTGFLAVVQERWLNVPVAVTIQFTYSYKDGGDFDHLQTEEIIRMVHPD